jgi:hypothetical protein
MSDHTNIVRLKAVNQALCGLLEQDFAFVGGAVVSLYADRFAEEVRPTDDVDVLVEVYTRIEYTRLEERLRQLGFRLDTSAKFVGRFIIQNLIVDFMPLEEKVLGFNNLWYKDGLKHAKATMLDERNTIKIFTAPYFLASKIEAFKSRGKNKRGQYDGRFSTDFEDIIFVLTNRNAIWQEIEQSESKLKSYFIFEFTKLIENADFEEWIDAHTGYGVSAAQAIILPSIRRFLAVPGK